MNTKHHLLVLAILLGACAHAPAAPEALPPPRARPYPPSPLIPPGLAPLDPPRRFRVPVGRSPARGPADAKVTIVEFSDLHCTWCSFADSTMAKLEHEYGPDVRVVWKNAPSALEPKALPSSLAAAAADEQGRFWALRDLLSVNFTLTWFDDARLHEYLEQFASQAGLDLPRWRAAMASKQVEDVVRGDAALAARLGVSAPPVFFINGRRVAGAQPLETFEAVVDDELELADAQLAQGVARGSLYDALTRGAPEELASAKPLPDGACPPPPADAPRLQYDGKALVAACRDLYFDPELAPADRDRLLRGDLDARRFVAALFPALASTPLRTVYCRSDACQRHFAGPSRRSVVREPGAGSAGGDIPSDVTTIAMCDTGPGATRVLAHELVHVGLEARLEHHAVAAWFNEGLAASLSGRPYCSSRTPRGIDDLRRLDGQQPWNLYTDQPGLLEPTYCQARAEVEAYVRKHGRDGFEKLLDAVRDGGSFDELYGPLAAP